MSKSTVAHPRVEYGTAANYLESRFSVIPLRPRSKRPALPRWRQYQRIRPTEYELRHWWDSQSDTDYGIAIVCGQVSDGLVVLDFDTMDGYRQWRTEHRSLAKSAPTTATFRGRHVFVRLADPVKTTSVGDVDIRADGSYVVAPPSIHPSGRPYRLLSGSWDRIPLVDHLPIPSWDETQTGPPHDTQAHALPTQRSRSRSPTSRDTLVAVVDRAKHIEIPPAADQYADPAMKVLVALCYCLSEHHQGRAYPLSCRVAGEAIGISHITAARWLRDLVSDGVLEITREAQHSARMAAEYRWVGIHRLRCT